jgi:aldehyde:ferredoxin oxidoreductase
LFLLKAGLSRADDTLAERMSEPMPAGPVEGEVFDLSRVLDEYYAERGWDLNGIPSREKLAQLDISAFG